MATVIIHATVTLDGNMADVDGGMDWMFGFPSAPEDEEFVQKVMNRIGAIRRWGQQGTDNRGG